MFGDRKNEDKIFKLPCVNLKEDNRINILVLQIQ